MVVFGMMQEAEIAEDLELLADFGSDVPVIGMELFQFTGEGINVFVFEFRFAEAVDDVQDVQRPTAFGDGQVFERLYSFKAGADFGGSQSDFVGDDGNTGVLRNTMEGDVAADPAGAAGGGR